MPRAGKLATIAAAAALAALALSAPTARAGGDGGALVVGDPLLTTVLAMVSSYA
jgi:hypothetical protein